MAPPQLGLLRHIVARLILNATAAHPISIYCWIWLRDGILSSGPCHECGPKISATLTVYRRDGRCQSYVTPEFMKMCCFFAFFSKKVKGSARYLNSLSHIMRACQYSCHGNKSAADMPTHEMMGRCRGIRTVGPC